MRRFIFVVGMIALMLLGAERVRADVQEELLFDVPGTGYWRQLILDSQGRGVGYCFEKKTGEQSLFLHGKWVEGYDSIPNDGVTATPDGEHVAFVGIRGGKEYAVIDGKEGPGFKRILGRMTAYSDHVFKHDDAIWLSADGKHSLYRALEGEKDETAKEKIFLDGKVIANVTGMDMGSISVSADWNHWAYTKREPAMGWGLVMDGQERRDVPEVSGEVEFSPDGKRLGYNAAGSACIIDGSEVTRMGIRGQVVFSPDGKRAAAKSWSSDDKEFVVLDGVAGPQFKKIYDVMFSPDGARLAYVGYDGKKCVVICNGKAGEAFDEIENFHFSPKGDQMIYQTNTYLDKKRGFYNPPQEEVIVCGLNGKAHSYPTESVAFDEDETHMAYVETHEATSAADLDKMTVFVDDQPVGSAVGEVVSPIRFVDLKRLVVIVDRKEKVYREEVTIGGGGN